MNGTCAGCADSLDAWPWMRAQTLSVCLPWRNSASFWIVKLRFCDHSLCAPWSIAYAYSIARVPSSSEEVNATWSFGSFVRSAVARLIAVGSTCLSRMRAWTSACCSAFCFACVRSAKIARKSSLPFVILRMPPSGIDMPSP